MTIDIKTAAEFFKNNDNFLLLCHSSPDGDTVGCATALARALKNAGKKVNIRCGDRMPKDFDMLFEGLELDDIEPEHIAALDVADPRLLGDTVKAEYGDRIEMCIDHHSTNILYADMTYLEPDSASAAEIVYNLIVLMGYEITPAIATCLYTGVSTDTGCFRFVNTTVRTFRIAADLAELGADTFGVSQVFFETKTKSYAALERLALNDMKFYFEDRCALICITRDMYQRTGSDDSETTKLAPLTRQVEGVKVGVMLRELKDGSFKASLRTNADIDASEICGRLGGGGHAGAAACTINATKQQAINIILKEIGAELNAAKD